MVKGAAIYVENQRVCWEKCGKLRHIVKCRGCDTETLSTLRIVTLKNVQRCDKSVILHASNIVTALWMSYLCVILYNALNLDFS